MPRYLYNVVKYFDCFQKEVKLSEGRVKPITYICCHIAYKFQNTGESPAGQGHHFSLNISDSHVIAMSFVEII